MFDAEYLFSRILKQTDIKTRARLRMCRGVTLSAQGDQIIFRIFSGLTAKSLVVDFQVGPGTAELTTPAVPPDHSLAEVAIFSFPKSG